MLDHPFLSVTLPLMVTFVGTVWAATWSQNKRLNDIIARLDRIETKVEGHSQRIANLEGSKWR